MKRNSKDNRGFFQRGQWFYKLPDPFCYMPYYPLDTKSISEILQVSQRTAVRICTGERELTHSELLNLQFKIFGYINDPVFSRAGFYIRSGILLCHKADNYELPAGELLEFALLADYYRNAVVELAQVKKRLADIENPPAPEPSNIIKFSDFKR